MSKEKELRRQIIKIKDYLDEVVNAIYKEEINNAMLRLGILHSAVNFIVEEIVDKIMDED